MVSFLFTYVFAILLHFCDCSVVSSVKGAVLGRHQKTNSQLSLFLLWLAGSKGLC